MRFVLFLSLLIACLSCAPKERGQTLPAAPLAKQKELLERLRSSNPQAPYRVSLPPGSPEFPENPDNRLTKAGVMLGRWLFYDPILSGDNTMSCGSCHEQARAFTDGRRFSLGIRGKHVGRNTMSLVNLAWGPRFFWDGRAASLEEQAMFPIKDKRELDQPIPELITELERHPVYPDLFQLAFGDSAITEERIGKAIAQFVRTIVSFQAPLDDVRRVEMGVLKENQIAPDLRKVILAKVDVETRRVVNVCGQCHSGTNYGKEGNYSALYGGTRITSNGLDKDPDDKGYGKVTKNPPDVGHFKVPDLRNIVLTAPYMHDGRFDTLEEVLDHYDHGIQDFSGLDPILRSKDGTPKKLGLSPEVKKNILMYLDLMTDPSFLKNENYANPFR